MHAELHNVEIDNAYNCMVLIPFVTIFEENSSLLNLGTSSTGLSIVFIDVYEVSILTLIQ